MAEKMITIEDVRHVAKLARLHMTPTRSRGSLATRGRSSNTSIKISELDVAVFAPMASHADHNVLREDVVEPGLPLDKVLAERTGARGRFFAVPKVIGGDEDSAG